MRNDLREMQLKELEVLKEFLRICRKYKLRYYCLGGTLLGAVRHKGFIPWDDDIDVGMPRPDFKKFEKIVRQELPEYMRYYSYKDGNGYNYYFPKITDSRMKVIDESAVVSAEREVWIDIFPLDGMPGNILKRKIHCFRLLTARMRLNYSLFSTNVNTKKERSFFEAFLVKAGTVLPVEKIFDSSKEFKRLDKLMQKYPYDKSEYLINFMGVHKLKEMFHKKIYGKGAWYTFEDIRIWGPENSHFVLKQMYDDYMNPPSEAEMNHHNIRIKE